MCQLTPASLQDKNEYKNITTNSPVQQQLSSRQLATRPVNGHEVQGRTSGLSLAFLLPKKTLMVITACKTNIPHKNRTVVWSYPNHWIHNCQLRTSPFGKNSEDKTIPAKQLVHIGYRAGQPRDEDRRRMSWHAIVIRAEAMSSQYFAWTMDYGEGLAGLSKLRSLWLTHLTTPRSGFEVVSNITFQKQM